MFANLAQIWRLTNKSILRHWFCRILQMIPPCQFSGYSYQVDKVNVGGFGGAPTCSRCSQRVYFNEEKRAIGKVWHIRCFTCGEWTSFFFFQKGFCAVTLFPSMHNTWQLNFSSRDLAFPIKPYDTQATMAWESPFLIKGRSPLLECRGRQKRSPLQRCILLWDKVHCSVRLFTHRAFRINQCCLLSSSLQDACNCLNSRCCKKRH